jgi:single-strand DNA-binding protein
MADFKERDMKNVTANVVGEVKTASFDWDGETISVTNFSLVEKKNGQKALYKLCSLWRVVRSSKRIKGRRSCPCLWL